MTPAELDAQIELNNRKVASLRRYWNIHFQLRHLVENNFCCG